VDTEANLKVRVRAAAMNDRDALAQFLSRAAGDENIDRFDVLGFLQEFALPVAQVEAGQLFIAKQGWAIVGLASVLFRQAGGIEIDALLIDPNVDRVRVASQLVEVAGSFARKVGASGMHVLATEAAKPDLEAIGFSVLGVDESIEATVALRMSAAT
jgi:N-acetylglutamate synthase-like GNAT family acetyltransferase